MIVRNLSFWVIRINLLLGLLEHKKFNKFADRSSIKLFLGWGGSKSKKGFSWNLVGWFQTFSRGQGPQTPILPSTCTSQTLPEAGFVTAPLLSVPYSSFAYCL